MNRKNFCDLTKKDLTLSNICMQFTTDGDKLFRNTYHGNIDIFKKAICEKVKEGELNHTISKETSLSFNETLNKKYTINNIQFLLSSVMCAGIHGLKTSNYSLRKDY